MLILVKRSSVAYENSTCVFDMADRHDQHYFIDIKLKLILWPLAPGVNV